SEAGFPPLGGTPTPDATASISKCSPHLLVRVWCNGRGGCLSLKIPHDAISIALRHGQTHKVPPQHHFSMMQTQKVVSSLVLACLRPMSRGHALFVLHVLNLLCPRIGCLGFNHNLWGYALQVMFFLALLLSF
ncbi:hypothetical protein U1Q18_011999, partial [Sarracenia purpurea var. burkii]